MPYLKFSRDKRGYESFSLFEASSGRQHQGRPRLLYWFRTAPHIKVGREPFSEETRRALEARNPDITFDWARLMATPIPPPDVSQQWRERRRAERSARRSAIEDVAATAEIADRADPSLAGAQIAAHGPSESSGGQLVDRDRRDTTSEGDEGQSEHENSVEVAAGPAETAGGASDGDKGTPARRRKRRRRRGRSPGHAQSSELSSAPVEPPPPVDEV